MGKPIDSKVSRKLTKKMARVATGDEGSKETESPEQHLSVPAVAVPQPLPAAHLQTRRERMLKKIFSKKESSQTVSGGSTGVKKKAPKSKKGRHDVAVVAEDDDEASSSGAQPATTSADRRLRNGTATIVERAAARAAKLARREATTAAAAAAAPTMQRKTSLNLSNAARHDMFVNELNLFNRVVDLPQFTEDPFGSIQQHLDNTMRKLLPQTADVGRRPVSQNGGGGGNNHYAGGRDSRRYQNQRR